MSESFAVHITFGTYGTRLHGGDRPTVHHSRNTFGESFEGSNPARAKYVRASMNEEPVVLTREQRLLVEKSMPGICERGGWTLHEAACRTDHVHLLLTIESNAKKVRQWIKTWLSQLLNANEEKRTWWAKGGSCKHVFDEDYFEAVRQYIRKQKTDVDSRG